MKNTFDVICCPHCGAEYLPAEIYIPDAFVGKPTNINKEAITGKISDFFGTTMNLDENYVCDKCSKPFRTHAKIQFFTQPIDVNLEYKSSFKKPSLFLQEE